MTAAKRLECVRHGEIRPPMPMPSLVNDLWRCPCGRTMVLASVAQALRDDLAALRRRGYEAVAR